MLCTSTNTDSPSGRTLRRPQLNWPREICVVPPSCRFKAEQLVAAAELGHEQQALRVGHPGHIVRRLIQFRSHVLHRSRGAIEEHDPVLVRFVPGALHGVERDPSAVGRVDRVRVVAVHAGRQAIHRSTAVQRNDIDVAVGGLRRIVHDLGRVRDLGAVGRPVELFRAAGRRQRTVSAHDRASGRVGSPASPSSCSAATWT